MIVRFSRGATSDTRFVRTEVFIKEQGFKEEFDEYDDYADTLALYDDNGQIMATGRVYSIDDRTFKLGRIAVLKEYRHMGLGSTIIRELEKRADALGAKSYYISAQVVAVPFYTKCGYTAHGDTYMEEHVAHIGMTKAREQGE